ncbi:MAG: hypothetical protein ABI609_09575 [Acidobacteriota bacterium]
MENAELDLAERFLRRESSAGDARALVKALLRKGVAEPARAEGLPSSAYGPALGRLQARLTELEGAVARERELVQRLADELEAAGDESRSTVLAATDAPLLELLIDILCERSRQQGARDPERSLRLAHLASEAARGMEGRVPAAKAADFRAQSRAQVGNALRIAGDFSGAHEAFVAAVADLEMGSGDPARGGFVFGRLAALFSDESRFEEALSTTRKAGRLFRAAGLTIDRSRSLILEATVLFYLDRVPEAIGSLDRAAGLLAGLNEPRLTLAVTLNRASYLLTTRDLGEAAKGVAAARQLAMRLGNPLDAPRVAWVEAQLQAERGRLPEAELELAAVRAEFLRLELPHEVALVTLEMALVIARQGRLAEAGALAIEALATFEALRVRPEALASLRVALNAARGEALRVELLRTAIRRLRR